MRHRSVVHPAARCAERLRLGQDGHHALSPAHVEDMNTNEHAVATTTTMDKLDLSSCEPGWYAVTGHHGTTYLF